MLLEYVKALWSCSFPCIWPGDEEERVGDGEENQEPTELKLRGKFGVIWLDYTFLHFLQSHLDVFQ